MAQAAADGTRVLLDGEGGDELFGLAAPLVADRLRAGDLFGALGLVYRAPGALGRPSRRSVRRYIVRAGLQPLAPAWAHGVSRRIRGPRRYVPPWMGADLAKAFAQTSDGAAWKRVAAPRWWAYLVDATLTGIGPALAYEHIRHRAAGAGMLARHPLMDVDVIETVLDTPPDLAFDPHVTRPLLREAMAGLLPEAIRVRPSKSSFDELFHASLAGPDLVVARALLGDRQAQLGAYVDLARLRSDLLDPGPPAPGAERMRWAVLLWRALTAECWLRAQDDPAALRRDTHAVGLAEPAVTMVAA
jgi:asparagine synthase (glutamine-hydrolysing)